LKKVGQLEMELIELRNFLDQLSAARTVEQLEAVADDIQEAIRLHEKTLELPGASRLREKGITTSNTRALQRKVARLFVSSEGMEILVGKSSRDNDTLTQRIAKADDFWFHVAGYSGSHVVLRNPKKLGAPPQQSLLEAARLAAYFSQARNAPKVEVHYSRRKYVSKPRGGKPGLMQLKAYKSVMVRPGLL
jgi:predicted ribosome quality control (RQC) complex YloA/Tae2 family protein